MTTGTEATMVRCRNGENSMILRDRRDSLLMGPNLEFTRSNQYFLARRAAKFISSANRRKVKKPTQKISTVFLTIFSLAYVGTFPV